MFESQRVASDTINSRYNEGGGCTEAFHCKYANRVSRVNPAPYSESPAFILQVLFFLSPTPPVLMQPHNRNLARLWACFLPLRLPILSVPPSLVTPVRGAARRVARGELGWLCRGSVLTWLCLPSASGSSLSINSGILLAPP